jgi:hypothetical protein|uniref:Uncharacterized protein n=1 Tax=Myoviridae sp. ctuJM17 TaxID=2825200 RepID=A0A8S5PKN4_9CAUD|nr:MAG TPA: hypothetical protein [Myoviridae sp. ctuJM17]
MNRLVFNEGGQPIFLDDIKLLQDNDAGFNRQFLNAISGKSSAFLFQPLDMKPLSVDQEKLTTTAKVYAGSIVVAGEIIDFPESTVTVKTWSDPLYVCIKETENEEREFEDGQTRPCRKSVQAYISTSKDGAKVAYNVLELPTLTELLRRNLGLGGIDTWKNIPVTFFNGYTGQVQYQKQGGSTRIKVKISSMKGEWDAMPGKGILFEVDSQVGSFLNRKWSGTFGTGGDDGSHLCALEFYDGKCSLRDLRELSGASDVLDSPIECPVSLIFEILE